MKVQDWLTLALVIVGSLALGYVARLISRKVLTRAGVTSPGRRAISFAVGLLGAIGAFAIAVEFIRLPDNSGETVGKLIGVGVIVGFSQLAIALWDRASEVVAERTATFDPTAGRLLIPVVRNFIHFAIYIVAGLYILSMFVPNLTGILAGLGIGGVALALAAKDSVENVFGALTILFDHPFAIGDRIRVDKVEGVVEEINIRSTRIRTPEDTVITLPNANLIRAAVENFGARRTRRQHIVLRLAPDSPSEAIEAFSRDLYGWIQGHSGFASDKTIVRLNGASEWSIGLLIQAFVEADTFDREMELRDAMLAEALRLRTKHGLTLSGQCRPPEEVVSDVSPEEGTSGGAKSVVS